VPLFIPIITSVYTAEENDNGSLWPGSRPRWF